MQSQKQIEKRQERDRATYLYHLKHPEAKLLNARDRASGYKSRQSVWNAIQRAKKEFESECAPAKL